jgi:general secretion pathway protein J
MKEAGFTLLELLISVTLLALLSLVLFGGFRFGTHAWDRSESATAGDNQIRHAQDAISYALARAYPELQTADPKDPHIYFDGEPGAVTFLGPAGDGSLSVITLSRQNAALTMTVTPELARDPRRQTVNRKLLDNVAAFDLAYYGAARPNDPARWYPVWRDTTRLPLLVRIRATLARRGPSWTEMVVAPRIAGDVNCDYDSLAKFCKGR